MKKKRPYHKDRDKTFVAPRAAKRAEPVEMPDDIQRFIYKKGATESETIMFGVLLKLEKPSPMSEIQPLYKDGKHHRMTLQHCLKRMIAKGLVVRSDIINYAAVLPRVRK